MAHISIDTAKPSLQAAPATSPNEDGWYNQPVTIHWTCSDALSGIAGACPADDTLTHEGAGVTATETFSDQAGNMTPATSPAVNIDKTAPVTTADVAAGWTTQNLTIHLSAEDNLSGVAATYCRLD